MDRLSELMQQPVDRPVLAPEHIIVPSRDLGNWLTNQLTRQSAQQVCANIRWHQPAGFIEEWSEQILEAEEQSVWDKASLQWAIWRMLPQWNDEEQMAGLPSVPPEDPNTDLKRFRLAGTLADVFDQYMIYRPQWLVNWRNSPDTESNATIRWQSRLWHELANQYPNFTDRALHNQQARDRISQHPPASQNLPARTFLVAPSLIPKASMLWFSSFEPLEDHHLHIFELAPYQQQVQATVDPDRTYDLFNQPEATDPEGLYTQWARQFVEYQSLAEECWSAAEIHVVNDASSSDIDTSLQKLQQILRNERPEQILSPVDDSIQLHAAHGPRREVEALYDALLHSFDQLDDLRPDDVLIVTPDLDTYAPYLRAVFEAPGDDTLKIPFRVADPTQQHRYRLVELVIKWLEVASGRFKVTQVLELLEHPMIQRATGLSEDDLLHIEQWLLDTRVRWGYNEEHKRQELSDENRDRPLEHLSDQNTWQLALDRIWSGWAYRATDHDELVHNRLPYDNVEGQSDQQRLGIVQRFIRHLWEWHQQSRTSLAWSEWHRLLLQLIDEWIAVDTDAEPALQWVIEQLGKLPELDQIGNTGPSKNVEMPLLREYLENHLLQERMSVARMDGRAVIGGMVALRNIPAKVVAIVGLNEGTFPGSEPVNPFDALQDLPQPGDRSRRKEDRQLFADYLLQVRQHCILTYTGRDQRSDDEVPPSILVTELLDLLTGNQQDRYDKWITRHPLHAFDRDEETDTPAITFFPARAEQHRQVRKPGTQSRPIAELAGLDHPVDPDFWEPRMEAEALHISLDNLLRFYYQPLRWYTERTLGVNLFEKELIEADIEPFDVDHLAKYQFMHSWLHRKLLEPAVSPSLERYRQEGMLPHGLLGQQAWKTLTRDLERQEQTILDQLSTPALNEPQNLELHLTVDQLPVILSGTSSLWVENCQVVVKTGGGLKPKDQLRGWIYHLVASADEKGWQTECWGSKKSDFNRRWSAEPLQADRAGDLLNILIKGMLIGTQHPLAMLPKSTYAWAESYRQQQDRERATAQARQAYHNEYERRAYRNESHDAYNQFLFRSVNPYDNAAMTRTLLATAEQIWNPMLEAIHE